MTVHCKDCAHARPDNSFVFFLAPKARWRFAKCAAPALGDDSERLVHPWLHGPVNYCASARKFEWLCGAEGKYFEPRNTKAAKSLIQRIKETA